MKVSMSSSGEQEAPESEFLNKLWETQFEVCDICNHSACYAVTLASGKLFFCHHHFNANKDALNETAKDIIDESQMLLR